MRSSSFAILTATTSLTITTFVFGPAPATTAAPTGTIQVASALETTPTGIAGDTADDPAIWVNTLNPSKSLVITNEKGLSRLTVFNLTGQVVQRVTTPGGFYGNVDVRGDIVAAAHSGILAWRVNRTAEGPRLVAALEASGNVATGGEGLCMWDPGQPGTVGGLYAINVNRSDFRVRVHPLTDSDGDGLLVVAAPVRDFRLDSEGEGCETDDQSGALYISEEDVGIWRYNLSGPAGLTPPKVMFAPMTQGLSADIEGLALADGVLYASAQNVAAPRYNWVSRFNAATGGFLGSFRVSDSTTSDDCDQTDGLDAYAGPLGTRFPNGLFVCQDGFNDAPGTSGSQNFKFASLDLVDG